MTRRVFTVRIDSKVIIADRIMDWARIRHVPVVDAGNRLAGLITHRDLLRASTSRSARTPAQLEDEAELWQIDIRSIMATDVETIAPTADVREAAKRMREGKIGCLPVVEGDQLVGIITESDLLRLIEEA